MSQRYQHPLPFLDSLENIENWPLAKDCISDNFQKDLISVKEFLFQYRGSKATFEVYRREIERVLQWCWRIRNASLLTLKRIDVEAYLDFCQKPPQSWIGTKQELRTSYWQGEKIANKRWRPFLAKVSKAERKEGAEPNKKQYQLSQAGITDIFKVLNSFYQSCLQEERVLANPVALIRQKSKYIRQKQTKTSVRRLTAEQWHTCLVTAKQMAEDNPESHARTLFIISALYYLYLRISELIASERWIPQMKHFYQDSQKQWWFKTVGKGNKERDIAVSQEMLAALKAYRKHRGLSPLLPTLNDDTSLLHSLRGNENITSRGVIQRAVQECFDQTIESLKQRSKLDEAESLAHASAHWLRHTGISDDINERQRPLAHVRDDAGHASIVTTDRYNDIELTERYKSARKKASKQKKDK